MGTWARSNQTNRRRLYRGYQVCKPMEGTVKLRLLLTSTLFLFAQMPTMEAQETLDLAKITCEQLQGEKLATPSRDIVLMLTGYYNAKPQQHGHRTPNSQKA